MPSQFPILDDKKRFPILCSMSEACNHALMTCDDLAFFAPEQVSTASLETKMPGTEWHLYGDTRWPSSAAWVEFPLTHYAFLDHAGVLVIRAKIPSRNPDAFEWIAANHPLGNALPAVRSASMFQQLTELLQTHAQSDEVIAGPADERPRYVQSYCIYHYAAGEDQARFAAAYTDLLNTDGVVIPRFRMGEFKSQDLSLYRFSLHALFRLNAARISGTPFVRYSQLSAFGPAQVTGETIPPMWTAFHPSRTLRTRPAVRALATPALRHGFMEMADYEQVLNVRRREANSHTLAFERIARPRDMAFFNVDTNSTMAAFIHRAHGGAIYVIPDRLVDEFHHTECSEVRVGDIKLPFASVFLKFTPPEPVWLDQNARVDGCYVVKQGTEFLFTLTARIDGVDYENSMSLACLDPIFALHVPTSDAQLPVNSAIELGIEAFLLENQPPAETFSGDVERPDGTMTHVEDIRARSRKRRIERFHSQEPAFRRCLNIIVNAACFITFRPHDLSDAWEGEPSSELLAAANAAGDTRRSRDRKLGALRKLESGDFTRVKICGAELFLEVRRSDEAEADAKSPRAHWRRGHWRRQRYGPGLTLIVLRWIRPTIVMQDHGTPVEARIYEI